MSATETLYYERELAKLLGLSREELRYIRYELLKKEGGWRREGRDVVITQPGLEKILDHLKSTTHTFLEVDFTPALVTPPEKKEAATAAKLTSSAAPENKTDEANGTDEPSPAKKVLEELTVVRCYPNPCMLRAATPAGELVDVRVKTNRNFVPKMKLRGRMVCPGKYEMEGRCPRTRGRY